MNLVKSTLLKALAIAAMNRGDLFLAYQLNNAAWMERLR